MTLQDLQAILPLIVVAATAVTVMLVISFYRNQTVSAMLTLSGLLMAGACLSINWGSAPYKVDPLLRIDGFANFYIGFLLVASFVVTVLSHSYLEKYRMERGEFYVLLLLSVLGALTLAAADHFVTFFLGLELLSVSLYVMVGYIFTKEKALEAAVKYLFLAAATSAFLLFGMALFYAELGTMEFSSIAARLQDDAPIRSAYITAGTILIIAGAAFKLSVVPFHMWTPDIYQGAPAPVTAFLATVSKGCVVAVLLRFFSAIDLQAYSGIFNALAAVTAASMLAGNLLALLQDNIKRILAYSSIAHFGYLLVAFLSGGDAGAAAATFYLVTYFAATLVAFGTIGYLSPTDQEADTIEDYRGLFWRRPGPAILLGIAIFSLLGLPLTAGFMGKFFVVGAGTGAELWALLIILAASSATGLYYYLRIVIAMYTIGDDAEIHRQKTAPPPFAASVGTTLAVLAIFAIAVGVYPEPVISLVNTATESLEAFVQTDVTPEPTQAGQ